MGSSAWVRAEDARPGTTAWRAPGSRTHLRGLDAFADRVSVLPGQEVGLEINANGSVQLRAFRFGWYAGDLARLVWSGSAVARPQPPPVELNAPIADAGGARNTRTVIAPWRTTTLVNTTGWPEGEYLLRIDSARATRFVPLTVRSSSAAGRELIVAGTMTWQAYNLWGGRSLYGDDNRNLASRSYAVSYDRPYLDGAGAGRWPEFDSAVAEQAERAGVPLAWTTDYDLALSSGILRGAAAIVIGGHAEYWTGPMRDAVVAAVGAGANLAVLGANTAYWRVRLAGRRGAGDSRPAARQDGTPRLIFGAKDAGLDPLASRDPGAATTKFRSPPAARREDALTGMQYDCHPAEAPLTIADPGWWGFAGTGLTRGQQLAHVVGPESDRVYPVPGRPGPMDVVAYTRFDCAGRPTAQTSVYWVARSGAGVFTAGTMRWNCASTGFGCSIFTDPRVKNVMGQITRNVLAGFGTARAGLRHPATDTVARYWLPSVNTTGAA